jgi:hypothetical protein
MPFTYMNLEYVMEFELCRSYLAWMFVVREKQLKYLISKLLL